MLVKQQYLLEKHQVSKTWATSIRRECLLIQDFSLQIKRISKTDGISISPYDLLNFTNYNNFPVLCNNEDLICFLPLRFWVDIEPNNNPKNQRDVSKLIINKSLCMNFNFRNQSMRELGFFSIENVMSKENIKEERGAFRNTTLPPLSSQNQQQSQRIRMEFEIRKKNNIDIQTFTTGYMIDENLCINFHGNCFVNNILPKVEMILEKQNLSFLKECKLSIINDDEEEEEGSPPCGVQILIINPRPLRY
jgi:hypothetical protein